MVLALVVFSGALLVLSSTMQAQSLQQSRISQLEEAQVAIQRLVRDLRQASSVTVNSSTSVSYTEPVSGTSQSVTVSCSTSTGQCLRTVNGVSTIAVSDLTNSDVFSGSPSSTPTYIGVKLVISAANHTTVTLSDGAGLRDVLLGG
jgi:type II secretory pathway component PulJ